MQSTSPQFISAVDGTQGVLNAPFDIQSYRILNNSDKWIYVQTGGSGSGVSSTLYDAFFPPSSQGIIPAKSGQYLSYLISSTAAFSITATVSISNPHIVVTMYDVPMFMPITALPGTSIAVQLMADDLTLDRIHAQIAGSFGSALVNDNVKVLVTSDDINDKGVSIRGTLGQVALLLEILNSVGATLLSVDNNGTLTALRVLGVAHADTSGQTTDDHHNLLHHHDGVDGSGTVSHANTTGKTANDHHNQSHVLATGTAIGGDHTISGATAGEVLRALSATTAAFDQLQHTDLGTVTADQHHNQAHGIDSTDHTGTLGIAKGGTNAGSFGTTNGVAYYNGTAIVNDPDAVFDGARLLLNNGAIIGGPTTLVQSATVEATATGSLDRGFSSIQRSADAVGAVVSVGKSRNANVGSFTAVNNADEIGRIHYRADDGVGMQLATREAGSIRMVATENWDASHHGAQMLFYVVPTGGTTVTLALALDGTAAVQIAKTIAAYNGVSTEGVGVPYILDRDGRTGQSAAITAQTASNSTATGEYRFSAYLVVTTGNAGAPVNLNFIVNHVDDTGAATIQIGAQISTNAAGNDNCNGRSNEAFFRHVGAGATSITWQVNASGGLGTARYAVYTCLERLN